MSTIEYAVAVTLRRVYVAMDTLRRRLYDN